MDHQVPRIGSDDDVPSGVRRRCELLGCVVEVPDQRPDPVGCCKVVTGLERHEDVPLDVLEDVATQFVEAEGARGSVVAHCVEVAEQRVD